MAEDQQKRAPTQVFRPIPLFDRSLLIMLGLVLVSGTACWFIAGEEAFKESFSSDFALFVQIVPKLAAALLVASFIQLMVPRKLVAKWIGEESGVKGAAVSSALGALTPGGPMTSFPIVNALQESGTGRAPLIAYLTSWSTLGFQRILIWELPLLGLPFVILRYISCLPLPFLAAWLSTKIPIDIKPKGKG